MWGFAVSRRHWPFLGPRGGCKRRSGPLRAASNFSANAAARRRYSRSVRTSSGSPALSPSRLPGTPSLGMRWRLISDRSKTGSAEGRKHKTQPCPDARVTPQRGKPCSTGEAYLFRQCWFRLAYSACPPRRLTTRTVTPTRASGATMQSLPPTARTSRWRWALDISMAKATSPVPLRSTRP